MARYNEILVGRFARGIQKIFGIKGEVPVGSLAGELNVTHNLLNGVENRYLEGWDRFGLALLQAAVAAQASRLQFRNPAGSNCIAVFERLSIANNTAADQPTWNMGTSNVDLATVSTAIQVLDPRGRTKSTLIPSSQAAAGGGVGTAFFQTFITANSAFADLIFFEDHEIALLPGQVLQVVSNTVNQPLVMSAIWRERFLEESERT